ncbi:hypothetical protein AVEN_248613-1 [Araneus ventricosus]|uniref:Uncharacterized protein n=1 Tax=Araneus ventricosus TaxID=182803 RepID=A0A4Y2TZC6_ARAVE|nr:hypothetical protein AVEN_248613-1 [Araneus ventricosus]
MWLSVAGLAILSKGKPSGTWWKPIGFCRISLLDSGYLVIFSSPSLGISNMAVALLRQQRVQVGQLDVLLPGSNSGAFFVAPRQYTGSVTALLGQQSTPVGQLDILLRGFNSKSS